MTSSQRSTRHSGLRSAVWSVKSADAANPCGSGTPVDEGHEPEELEAVARRRGHRHVRAAVPAAVGEEAQLAGLAEVLARRSRSARTPTGTRPPAAAPRLRPAGPPAGARRRTGTRSARRVAWGRSLSGPAAGPSHHRIGVPRPMVSARPRLRSLRRAQSAAGGVVEMIKRYMRVAAGEPGVVRGPRARRTGSRRGRLDQLLPPSRPCASHWEWGASRARRRSPAAMDRCGRTRSRCASAIRTTRAAWRPPSLRDNAYWLAAVSVRGAERVLLRRDRRSHRLRVAS